MANITAQMVKELRDLTGAGMMDCKAALNETGGYRPVAFIDSNTSLAGQVVHGVKVLRPEKIGKVIADESVDEVLLATPSALRGERRLALKALEAFPVTVKTLLRRSGLWKQFETEKAAKKKA